MRTERIGNGQIKITNVIVTITTIFFFLLCDLPIVNFYVYVCILIGIPSALIYTLCFTPSFAGWDTSIGILSAATFLDLFRGNNWVVLGDATPFLNEVLEARLSRS